MFLAAVAERRGFALPPPAMLAMDARAVAEEIPADLLPLACKRLWTRFAYRRLPEPSDFAKTVEDELRERREAAAKVHTVALKVKTARMQARWQREAAKRHAASRAHERALAGAARTAPDGGGACPFPAPPASEVVAVTAPDGEEAAGVRAGAVGKADVAGCLGAVAGDRPSDPHPLSRPDDGQGAGEPKGVDADWLGGCAANGQVPHPDFSARRRVLSPTPNTAPTAPLSTSISLALPRVCGDSAGGLPGSRSSRRVAESVDGATLAALAAAAMVPPLSIIRRAAASATSVRRRGRPPLPAPPVPDSASASAPTAITTEPSRRAPTSQGARRAALSGDAAARLRRGLPGIRAVVGRSVRRPRAAAAPRPARGPIGPPVAGAPVGAGAWGRGRAPRSPGRRERPRVGNRSGRRGKCRGVEARPDAGANEAAEPDRDSVTDYLLDIGIAADPSPCGRTRRSGCGRAAPSPPGGCQGRRAPRRPRCRGGPAAPAGSRRARSARARPWKRRRGGRRTAGAGGKVGAIFVKKLEQAVPRIAGKESGLRVARKHLTRGG
jgi:hypothetical protein